MNSDVESSHRLGTPLYGLQPAASLDQHAWMALQELRDDLVRHAAGEALVSARGNRRVLPATLPRMIQAYVTGHFVPARYQDRQARGLAMNHYRAALHNEVALLLEGLAMNAGSDVAAERADAAPWLPTLRHIGFPEG